VKRWSWITRDGAIVAFALAWGTGEIFFLGARPAVLSFLTVILVSPVAIHLDEARRAAKREAPQGEDR
jgi:hypothetical protein